MVWQAKAEEGVEVQEGDKSDILGYHRRWRQNANKKAKEEKEGKDEGKKRVSAELGLR